MGYCPVKAQCAHSLLARKPPNPVPLRASAIVLKMHHVAELIEQLGGFLTVSLYIEEKTGHNQRTTEEDGLYIALFFK